jgi:hypothetical protein
MTVKRHHLLLKLTLSGPWHLWGKRRKEALFPWEEYAESIKLSTWINSEITPIQLTTTELAQSQEIWWPLAEVLCEIHRLTHGELSSDRNQKWNSICWPNLTLPHQTVREWMSPKCKDMASYLGLGDHLAIWKSQRKFEGHKWDLNFTPLQRRQLHSWRHTANSTYDVFIN